MLIDQMQWNRWTAHKDIVALADEIRGGGTVFGPVDSEKIVVGHPRRDGNQNWICELLLTFEIVDVNLSRSERGWGCWMTGRSTELLVDIPPNKNNPWSALHAAVPQAGGRIKDYIAMCERDADRMEQWMLKDETILNEDLAESNTKQRNCDQCGLLSQIPNFRCTRTNCPNYCD